MVNEVLVRMREDEVTSVADPDNDAQQKIVCKFVQDANDSNKLVERPRKAQANESVPERLLKVKQMRQTFQSHRVKQPSERIVQRRELKRARDEEQRQSALSGLEGELLKRAKNKE